jgi:hypothetical protein
VADFVLGKLGHREHVLNNASLELLQGSQFYVVDLVRRRLATLKDSREVIADPKELYDGAKITERTLLPGKDAQLGKSVSKPGSNNPHSVPPNDDS